MMKKRLFAAMGVCATALGAFAAVGVAADAPIALVPQPLRVERKEGEFVLNKDTRILVEQGSTDAANVGKQLADRLNRSTGFGLTATPFEAVGSVRNAILLTAKNANVARGAEGYQLDATADGVLIAAAGGAGLFYGTQTLLQLLPPQVFSPNKKEETVAWTVPAVHIEDQPRFVWRGLMLDVSRHFFNKEEIKNFLDLMAQHKLNTFQWHLTDDQGWRIEIKRYPKLTEIGAWRSGIGFGLDPKATKAYGPDGRYGGFFTHDDVREIVAYAKDRYITVVPEIEMPGHAVAALAAYPELSCTGKQFDTEKAGGEFDGIYCVGNDASLEFLEDVLGEVCDLFPGKRIHVGGDEVGKKTWKKCPKCQARIHEEGLKNEEELQSYFIRRIEKFLNAHGRTLIGWDEILEGGLAPNATVMSWQGIKGGIAAANAGHEVVMAPMSHCYFDSHQAPKGEPLAHGETWKNGHPSPLLNLETVYGYDPVPAVLPADKARYILGTGGNLWSEYFPNYAHVQYMAYPRACAMSEVTWTEAKQKNWEDFQKRLETHLQRLKAQGVNYRHLRPS